MESVCHKHTDGFMIEACTNSTNEILLFNINRAIVWYTMKTAKCLNSSVTTNSMVILYFV